MERRPQAVIFDLDGTMTDTEKYYHDAWKRALNDFGYSINEDELLSLRSFGRPFAPMWFKERYGEGFDYNAVREQRKLYVREMMDDNGIPLKRGAKEVATLLRQEGLKTAVATANDVNRAKMYLERTGLEGCFDEVICADMVERGKPAPDIYLYACKSLGLSPDRVVAVEDSPNGITSAFEAGCITVMVPDLTLPDEELSKKIDVCIDDLFMLPKILGL